MLDKHNHLLLRDETLEILPRLCLLEGFELWSGAVPEDSNSYWKKVSHEMTLAGKLNFHGPVTEATRPSITYVDMVSFHSPHGVLKSAKLDIGIHGLAGHSLHDDVDRFISIVEDTRVAPKERHDLCTLGSKRNLHSSLS